MQIILYFCVIWVNNFSRRMLFCIHKESMYFDKRSTKHQPSDIKKCKILLFSCVCQKKVVSLQPTAKEENNYVILINHICLLHGVAGSGTCGADRRP